jgi:L-histidine Nalpha-methyltransferase
LTQFCGEATGLHCKEAAIHGSTNRRLRAVTNQGSPNWGARLAEEKEVTARLVIHDRVAPGRENEFAEAVRTGFTSRPRFLATKFFYDALGSYLFEAICLLPEYYLTRAESEILGRYSHEIIDRVDGNIGLVELGSGSAVKARYLIRALLERQERLHYQPIDISKTMLAESSASLLGEFPGLSITGIAGDYTATLELTELQRGERRLALFLGSNIGNYDPTDARALIARLRAALAPGDALLIGADLRKDRDILEAAYDDSLGVTSAFNLNLLQRINRELGADFDVRKFRHRAIWNDAPGRMEMYLESLESQSVRIRSMGLRADFEAGELIHTENSYKYRLEDLATLAEETGFRVSHSWFDEKRQFSCNLWLTTD